MLETNKKVQGTVACTQFKYSGDRMTVSDDSVEVFISCLAMLKGTCF